MRRPTRHRPTRAAAVALLGVLALVLTWDAFAEGAGCSTSPDDLTGCFPQRLAVLGLGVPLLVGCLALALRGHGALHAVGGAVAGLLGGGLVAWLFSTVATSPVVASYAPLAAALVAAGLVALWADAAPGSIPDP